MDTRETDFFDGYLQAAVTALLCLFLSAVVLLGVYVVSQEPAAESESAPRHWQGSELRVVVGRGVRRGDALEITDYQVQGGLYHAVAVWRGRLQARDFDTLRFNVEYLGPSITLKFTWKSADKPDEVQATPLLRNEHGLAAISLHGIAGWVGTIEEIGVYAVADTPEDTALVRTLSLVSAGWRGRLESNLASWTAFRGWSNQSINFLLPTPREQDNSPLPPLAAWMGLALLLATLYGVARRGHQPLTYALILFIPWLLLDLLWQDQLRSQLRETRELFAGKSMHEKHLADVDAYIYKYVTRIRKDFLPDEPATIILTHKVKGHNYERLKAQYYLLPHNVFNYGKGPAQAFYRKGDFVLVLSDSADPAYDADSGTLSWQRGPRLQVKELDVHSRGRLYQVLADGRRRKK